MENDTQPNEFLDKLSNYIKQRIDKSPTKKMQTSKTQVHYQDLRMQFTNTNNQNDEASLDVKGHQSR